MAEIKTDLHPLRQYVVAFNLYLSRREGITLDFGQLALLRDELQNAVAEIEAARKTP